MARAATAPQAFAADVTARELATAFYRAKSGEPLNLAGKDLSFLDLAGIDFKGAYLPRANLFGVDLTTANLRSTNLAGVTLDRAILVRADFSGANLEGASVMRPSVNISLERNKEDAPKFAGANLRHIRITAMMDGADFRGADLTGARLGPHEPRADISSMPGSLLRGCDFSGAILVGADLMWAKLGFSKFVGANLRNVNFDGADLSRVDFSGADLTGANLANADLDGAIFKGVTGWDAVAGLASARNWDRAVR
ncbi:MAG: pentapeptide repeat-containing protein [Hyphomicrobium sp.]